jgi:starch synthase
MVGSECAPVAKAGGLGDFIQGLSRELAKQGNEVEVILPKYDCLRWDRIDGLHKACEDLWVPFYGDRLPCDVDCGYVEGTRCFFIADHSQQGFFDRGRIYGESDDVERFAFFSRALLEFLLKTGKQPDIIHCHDWQTALVPALLRESYAALGLAHPSVCFTLHNLVHQGVCGDYVLHQVGLDRDRMMSADRLLDPGDRQAVNLLKGAIIYSSFVSTVSPRYAWESRHTEQGMGLQETLNACEHKFAGVINGIDQSTWNPLADPLIPQPYGPSSLPGKACCKSALRRRLRLEEAAKPLVSIVSRLDRQKGVDLMRHGIRYALERGCQVVLLGSASEDWLDAMFREIKDQTEGSPDCRIELGFDEELAHQIYAGADMIVVPSVYEPCGLTQLVAMKYAVVPVVRRVGGLADTVFDANYSDKTFEERNGYLFDDQTGSGLESAMNRAIWLWFEHPEYFRQLRLNGMHIDYSWTGPAQQYLEIYAGIQARNR